MSIGGQWYRYGLGLSGWYGCGYDHISSALLSGWYGCGYGCGYDHIN